MGSVMVGGRVLEVGPSRSSWGPPSGAPPNLLVVRKLLQFFGGPHSHGVQNLPDQGFPAWVTPALETQH